LLSAAIVAAIVLGFRPLAPVMVSLLLASTLMAFVLLTWLMMRRHDRRLCESCAASMPLNPAEHAARYRRRFWLAHAGSRPGLLVPYLVVLVGSNFLLDEPGRFVWAVVQSSMIYLILSHASHRKLQPWCPWCSDDGGGDKYDIMDDPKLPRGDHPQLV